MEWLRDLENPEHFHAFESSESIESKRVETLPCRFGATDAVKFAEIRLGAPVSYIFKQLVLIKFHEKRRGRENGKERKRIRKVEFDK